MKKTILLGAVMLTAAAGFAQESRQDISVSGFGLIGPTVHGNNDVSFRSTKTGGVLLSYRYLVTPHSGLELNYSFAQYTNYYTSSGNPAPNPIHLRQQELSGAYVYSRTYKNYNPFVEAGVGGFIFTPIQEGTYSLDARQGTSIGALFGGGLAYEISPSFDIRAQYRGVLVKAPSFVTNFVTRRYEVISEPTIGVAYHF